MERNTTHNLILIAFLTASLFLSGAVISGTITQDVMAFHDTRHHEVNGEKCSTAYELDHPVWTIDMEKMRNTDKKPGDDGYYGSFTYFTGDNPLPLCDDLLEKYQGNITSTKGIPTYQLRLYTD